MEFPQSLGHICFQETDWKDITYITRYLLLQVQMLYLCIYSSYHKELHNCATRCAGFLTPFTSPYSFLLYPQMYCATLPDNTFQDRLDIIIDIILKQLLNSVCFLFWIGTT